MPSQASIDLDHHVHVQGLGLDLLGVTCRKIEINDNDTKITS